MYRQSQSVTGPFVPLCFLLCALVAGCEQSTATAVQSPPPPPVNVIAPVQREVQNFDEFTGRVAADQSVEVRSRVGGYLVAIGFKDGDEVVKDQLLFQIDPKPYQAELDAAKAARKQAQAEFDFGSREVERLKPLLAQGVASAKEASEAQDRADRGAASIAKAEAEIEARQLDVNFAAVKSPISGRVSKANFTVGNLIAGDTLLTTVVSIDPILVNLDVDERRLLFYRDEARRKGQANLKSIRDANLPIFVALANETDFPHKGVIRFVDNQVDALTGSIRVTGEFPNADRILTPGQFVRAKFPRGDAKQELLVPDRAIGRDQDRKYLLVVNDKNIVEYRSVETGGSFGEDRVILQGLKPGEHVVIDGLQRARPGQPVTPTLSQPTTQTATTR